MKQFPTLRGGRDPFRVPLDSVHAEQVIGALVGLLGGVESSISLPLERIMGSHSASADQADHTDNTDEPPAPTRSLDNLGRNIHRSTAERFVASTEERIDTNLIREDNKSYIAMWTNRVAMWRFFDRYVVPIIKQHYPRIEDYLRYHGKAFEEMGGAKPGKVSHINPFEKYAHAFWAVRQAWNPLIRRQISHYRRKNRNGMMLIEELTSISHLAFIHALEKQAMAILGNSEAAQGIPFPNRLERAMQKAVYTYLPDLTGPMKVPMESEARKNMPTEVPFDYYPDDNT